MPIVDIKSVGKVQFPDEFSHEQIVDAITSQVIPQFKAKQNKTAIADIGTKLKQGVERLPGMLAGAADIPFAIATGRPVIEPLATKAGEITGFQPSKWAEESEKYLSPAYQEGKQAVNQAWEDKNKSGLDVAKAYLSNPRQIVGTIAEAVPMTAAAALTGGAAGAGLGVESLAARAAVAGLGEGVVTAGSIYDQAIKGGAAPEDARRKALAATGAGVVTGGIGAAGAGLARRLGIVDPESIFNKPAVQTLTQAEINTFMNAANRGIGSRIGVGMIKEGLLEELPQSAQEQMWQNYAEKKPIMQGVARSAVEGALAGSAMGGGINLISKSMSVDEVKAEVDRRTKIKADEILANQERMATEAMGGTRESRPLETALAEQTREDKMGRENVRTELARPIYQTKEEITTVLGNLRDVYPELDQKQLNQTRVELQRIRETLPTQAEAAKALVETKPTIAQPVAPIAEPTTQLAPAPEVNPLVIDDALLNQWGVTGRTTRNALKEYSDLTNPEHVMQVFNILNDYPKSNAQRLAAQQGLLHLSNLPTQGVPDVQTPTPEVPASGSVQDSGAYTAPVGQGSLPGMELPSEQPQPATQEITEPGRGGVDIPSGIPSGNIEPVGGSPVAQPSALEQPAPAPVNQFPRVDATKGIRLGPMGLLEPKVVAEDSPLFHETNIHGLNNLLYSDRDFDTHGIFVSNNPDLAIGQGGNKGIKLEFRPNSVSGAENVKPGTAGAMGDLAGREYKADIIAPRAISKITVPNIKALRGIQTFVLKTLQAQFDRVDNADGSITFTRKGLTPQAAPALEQPAPAPEEVALEQPALEQPALEQPALEQPAPAPAPAPEEVVAPEVAEDIQQGEAPAIEVKPAPEADVTEEAPKRNLIKDIKRYQLALADIDPEIALDVNDLISEYNQARKGGKKGSVHVATAEQGLRDWMDWADRTYPELNMPALLEKGRRSSSHTTVEKLNAALGRLFTPNLLAAKPPNVFATHADIPEPLRSAVRGAMAFVTPKNQQEHYIADKIPQGEEIATILHEKGGHLGMAKLVGRLRINRLATQIIKWSESKDKNLENKIARDAIRRAAGDKKHGDNHWREEIVAYFADLAVHKYNIDPLKNQPKEFAKIAAWLRDLWNGVLSTVRKLEYNPETLTAHEIVSMVYGAARIEMHEDFEGRPNAPANEKVAKPSEEVESSIMAARPESFNPTGKAIKDVDLESMDLRPETTQKIRTIPAGTRLFHGAHGARADELTASGNILNARAPYKSGGGNLDEGGLLWFGDKDLAQGHANSEVDRGYARLEEERTGVKRRPGQVFSTVTEEPLKLISKYYEVTQEEADRLNEALGLPDYKQIKAGDDVDRAAFRAFEYRPSNISRYKAGNDTMGAPWPIIFETLGVDGYVDQSGIAIGVDTVATSPLQNIQEVRGTKGESINAKMGVPGLKKPQIKRVTDQERQAATAAGRQVYEEPAPTPLAERIKNSLGDNMLSWLAVKLVGGGESLALKGTKMFGPEARLNPVTGKELGYLNYHRALHDNDLATGAAQYGYLELDKEGVFHVRDSKENVVALNDLANKIKARMVADGMSEAAADDAFSHMMLTDRFKELQKQGIVSYLEFSKADHAYGQQMKTKYQAGYDAWQDMYQTIRGRTIKSLVESGTFSPKKAKDFLDRLEYIPFNRIQDENISDAVFLRSLLSAKGERYIKGSERQVKDVMSNIIDNQVWLLKRAVRNNASNLIADTMVEMHKRNPLLGGYETSKEDKSPNVISYLKDGELQYFKVLDANDAAIFASAPAVGNAAIRIMRMFTGYLRKGVTLMPSFHYGQIIQDAMRAPAVAGTKAGMAQLMKTSVPQFWHNIAGETPLARELRRAGIVGQIDYQDTYDNWRKEIVDPKRKGMATKLLERAESIAQANDLATRAAVYNDVLKETGNENEASLRALMMINFQNRGHSQVMNTLMAAVPFVNSRIQGEYRLLMALTGRIPGVTKQHAKQLIAWRAAKMAAFTAIYVMASSGDDDYEKAGEEIKNHNFLFGGVKVPVAPEFLPLKVGIEKAYRIATDQQFETGAKAARAELSSIAGLFLGMGDITPTLIKPLLENATNYSFFTGHTLVGFNQLSKDTNLQFNEGTSEFSKGFSNILQEIGGNTLNISPVKMDNLIRGWFGTLGKDFLYTVDMIAGDKPITSFNQLPLAGGMFYNMEGGALKSDFYDLKDEADRARNTLNDMKKNNPEKVREYYEEHKPLLAIHGRLTAVNNYLDHARKEKAFIKKTNPDNAGDRINEVNARVNEMLKRSLPPIMNYLAEQDAR